MMRSFPAIPVDEYMLVMINFKDIRKNGVDRRPTNVRSVVILTDLCTSYRVTYEPIQGKNPTFVKHAVRAFPKRKVCDFMNVHIQDTNLTNVLYVGKLSIAPNVCIVMNSHTRASEIINVIFVTKHTSEMTIYDDTRGYMGRNPDLNAPIVAKGFTRKLIWRSMREYTQGPVPLCVVCVENHLLSVET